MFGYLFRGASAYGTVDGPVQKVRSGDDYDYQAVVRYRPQEDVADLCRNSGVCRAIVDVPRNASVGDEIRVRYLLSDPTRAHSFSWAVFGVPGEMLIPFVLAVLAVLIGVPLLIWHLRYRRTPSAADDPARTRGPALTEGATAGDETVFFARHTHSHEMMPAGGPDPSAHWGRRYEQTRDDLLDRFIGDGHQPQVWRFRANSGEGGSIWVSMARCARCDYRTRIHRFPLPWARYRGDPCVPMTDAQLGGLATQKAHREARSGWLLGAVLSAVMAVAVLMMVLSGDYTHPMLRVLGVVAAVAAVYWFTKAIRRWDTGSRPGKSPEKRSDPSSGPRFASAADRIMHNKKSRFEAKNRALIDALSAAGHEPSVAVSWSVGEGGGARVSLKCGRCGEQRRSLLPERWQTLSPATPCDT
jgi:hypothetical protein